MARPRFPLLSRVVVALAAAGLLPLAISYYQLRTNKDALADQVGRTHIVASRAAAARVDARLDGLLTLARSNAAHPVLLSSPRSAAAQELLSGTLVAQPSIVMAGVFDPAGETVVMVRRNDLKEEIGDLSEAERSADGEPVSIVHGATRRWLRIRAPLPAAAGHLELLADAESLSDEVQAFQIGEQALVALASRVDDAVFGGADSLDAFPPTLVEEAKSGKLDSGKSEHSDPAMGDAVVGHARLENAPWFVLSRQPAAVAKVAQEGIRRATLFAVLAAMLIMAALSGGAYATIIQPLRRLAAAQIRLAGGAAQDAEAGGSEIDQLEASFEQLRRRIRDSEDLGQVFLGRYQVTGLIGSGAMGSVFRGLDPKLKRDLALKTIRVNAEDVAEYVDENTIGVAAVVGTTFTGHADDVAGINDYLVKLKAEKGIDVPMHVDGASGAFVWPFLYPNEKWDFRLEQVRSINASGHKFGLVYPGVGWLIFREKDDLNPDLVFMENYLGKEDATFTLNFSTGSAMLLAQYYQFVRLGRKGYEAVIQLMYANAKELASRISSMGKFELIGEGSPQLPLVAFKLK